MGKKVPFRYRVEIWEIDGRRCYAQIWLAEEWICLPVEQRPDTARFVEGVGWVNLRPVDQDQTVDGQSDGVPPPDSTSRPAEDGQTSDGSPHPDRSASDGALP